MTLHSTIIVTAQEMRALDAWTIEDFGLGVDVLMESAGRRVAELMIREYGRISDVIVVFGPGHNGADGLVTGRVLQAHGLAVTALSPFARTDLTPACQRQLQRCERLGMNVTLNCEPSVVSDVSPSILCVDALFGTGLGRALSGVVEAWVDWMNQTGSPTIAVDVPSGVCAQTGQVLGSAVRATLTVSFQFSKIGHWVYPGAGYRGHLCVEDIGIPIASLDLLSGPRRRVLERSIVDELLPERAENGHKGTFGHVGVVGGHVGMTGAAKLSGLGVLRSGAGKCTVLCEPRIVDALACELDVLMCVPTRHLEHNAKEVHCGSSNSRYDAYVIGVGVDPSRVGSSFGELIYSDAYRVVDAGALTWLSQQPPQQLGERCILTPHPAEAARLLGTTVEVVQADRFDAVTQIARKFDCVVVLKGAYSLIFGPGYDVVVCPYGNAGLGTAGTGDVLAGLLAGLLAQGCSTWNAARLGVVWHALAGDRTRDEKGEHSMIAVDLIDCLGRGLGC
jgi:ADP-dependent NAD(P)H-hydrate dehydratase / NAD(P)H-hydrate epimerase